MNANRRWMIYSHDALGLGHVRRGLAIARAVLSRRSDLATLLVTCSPVVDALPVPAGLDYIKLPSSRKVANGRYVPRNLPLDPGRLLDMRSELLRQAAMKFEPSLLLVDKTPGGLMNELEPTLRMLRADGRAKLVLGWRDILDDPETVSREWAANRTLELIDACYDEIWVYGDPSVFDVRKEYALPEAIAARVRYLGYLSPRLDEEVVARARAQAGADANPFALVTAGGGEDGEALMRCFLEAARSGLLPPELRALVVTGPCMPADARKDIQRMAPRGTEVRTFVPDLAPFIAAADVVVGMAGYNSACEMLSRPTRGVLVPRMRPRQEQRMRAERLEAEGLCRCIPPNRLDRHAMALAIERALTEGRPARPAMRTDGLSSVEREVRRILGGRGGLPATHPATEPGRASA